MNTEDFVALKRDFGAHIRQARKEFNLTQVQLAAKAGISLTALQNIEAGNADPRLSTVASLYIALELDSDNFAKFMACFRNGPPFNRYPD